MSITGELVARERRTVEAAFDEFYEGLITELASVCGNRASAERAVREAFRRAKARSDFAEIGWPRAWLLQAARNHLLRREFQTDSLLADDLGPAQTPSTGDVRPPSLDRALSQARRARLKRLAAVVGTVAAAIVLLTGAVLAGLHWAATTPAAAAVSAPISRHRTLDPWHPTIDDVVGNRNAIVVFSLDASDDTGSRLRVWKRCAADEFQAGPDHACLWGASAYAVEIRNRTGKTFTGFIPSTVTTITARPDGSFTVEDPNLSRIWSVNGGEPFERAPIERPWGRGVTQE